MRLREDQINRIAEKVAADLAAAELVVLKKERGAIVAAIRDAITADVKGEEALERDAAALLEQTLKSVGNSAGIDRHKMLKMIKEKLAKERKIVL